MAIPLDSEAVSLLAVLKVPCIECRIRLCAPFAIFEADRALCSLLEAVAADEDEIAAAPA